MTITAIPFDEIHLIEDGDFRTDPISVEATIDYIDENRWSITEIKVEAWGKADDGRWTKRLLDPRPEIDAAIRHIIMTSQSSCEFISEQIASEIRQDRALERPAHFNQWVLT